MNHIFLIYPAVLATIISVIGLGGLYLREHNKHDPQALSALAMTSKKQAQMFQAVLIACSILFAVSLYGFIAPRIAFMPLLNVAWTTTFVFALLTAVTPYEGKIARLHSIFGKAMAGGMLFMAVTFSIALRQPYNFIEYGLLVSMGILVILTFMYPLKFIYYEISYIFLSHVTILLALLAL